MPREINHQVTCNITLEGNNTFCNVKMMSLALEGVMGPFVNLKSLTLSNRLHCTYNSFLNIK